MASKQPQQIDIGQLPVPQLNQLVQQLDQEIELFTSSLNQLKIAQTKFVESQECLNKISPDNLKKDILVPLTSSPSMDSFFFQEKDKLSLHKLSNLSMYVPGQLSDVETVLIDIGTGYYVDMSVAKGKEYFKRKIEFVSKQMEKVQPLLAEKYKMKQVTVEILQLKIQNQVQSQAAAGAPVKT